MSNKIKILKFQLSTAIFSLVILLISGFFIFGPELTEMAKALSPNYSKVVGDNLGVGDWNNLPMDFVARSGGATSAMQGNLDMGNHLISNLTAPVAAGDAANRQYVIDTLNDFSFTDTSGNPLKVVCGQTPPGATNWQQTGGVLDVVWVDIDTSAAGFSGGTPPMYFTNLSGNTQLFRTYGSTSVYFPTNTGFRLYIVYAVGNLTPANANTWGWHIKWCGFGQ